MAFRAPPVAPRTAAMHSALGTVSQAYSTEGTKRNTPSSKDRKRAGRRATQCEYGRGVQRSAVRSIAARALLLTFGRQET